MNIKTITYKTEDGRITTDSATLIKDHGIKGDIKASAGGQLVMCDERSLKEYKTAGKGLCVRRFAPNLTTAGLNYAALKEGDRFKINGAIVEIASTFKKCYPECEFVQAKTTCAIKRTCAFAKIIEGGEIKSGDELIEL